MVDGTHTYPSVSAVTKRLEEVLRKATEAKPFWVRGELSSVTDRGASIYFDLVETRGGKTIAKLRCQIWRGTVSKIRTRLEEAGLSSTFANGMEVGLAVRVRFHAVFGLSLQVQDIDPEVTLGDLEARRRKIISRLKRDALLEANAARHLPLLVQRVGLVASRDTAGYADFVQTLQASPYGVKIFHADARVQGDKTEASILAALDALFRLDLDLVVIIRGGGGKLDLASLDNEAIARRIAAAPVVVWTGIGHETDESVLDLVAACAFKTPTAVAEAIVATSTALDDRLGEARSKLETAATLRLAPHREHVAAARAALAHATRYALTHHRANLDVARAGVRAARRLVDARRKHVEGAFALFAQTVRRRIDVARAHRNEEEKSLQKTATRALARAALVHDDWRRRLSPDGIARHIGRVEDALSLQRDRFTITRYLQILTREREHLAQRRALIRANDPRATLARGYALLYDDRGDLIVSTSQVAVGMRLRAHLYDGSLDSTVTHCDKEHADD